MARENWTFSDYINEIHYAAEISEIPGVAGLLAELIKEVKEKYPVDSKEIGFE